MTMEKEYLYIIKIYRQVNYSSSYQCQDLVQISYIYSLIFRFHTYSLVNNISVNVS